MNNRNEATNDKADRPPDQPMKEGSHIKWTLLAIFILIIILVILLDIYFPDI